MRQKYPSDESHKMNAEKKKYGFRKKLREFDSISTEVMKMDTNKNPHLNTRRNIPSDINGTHNCLTQNLASPQQGPLITPKKNRSREKSLSPKSSEAPTLIVPVSAASMSYTGTPRHFLNKK